MINHIRLTFVDYQNGYPVALIGKPENAFHALVPPEMRFETFADFLAKVDEIESAWRGDVQMSRG